MKTAGDDKKKHRNFALTAKLVALLRLDSIWLHSTLNMKRKIFK